jgi:hypothetical protein
LPTHLPHKFDPKKKKKKGQSCPILGKKCLKIARFSPKTKNPLKLLQRRNQACILHIDKYLSLQEIMPQCGQNSGNLNKIG